MPEGNLRYFECQCGGFGATADSTQLTLCCSKCRAMMPFVRWITTEEYEAILKEKIAYEKTEKSEPKAVKENPEESEKNLPIVFMKEEKLISFGETLSDSDYYVDIEETHEIGEPYVCMVNDLGKKRYFRKGEQSEQGTVLIPLNKEELRDLAIEETANDGFLKEFMNIGET
jgi:hypothetical protein